MELGKEVTSDSFCGKRGGVQTTQPRTVSRGEGTHRHLSRSCANPRTASSRRHTDTRYRVKVGRASRAHFQCSPHCTNEVNARCRHAGSNPASVCARGANHLHQLGPAKPRASTFSKTCMLIFLGSHTWAGRKAQGRQVSRAKAQYQRVLQSREAANHPPPATPLHTPGRRVHQER